MTPVYDTPSAKYALKRLLGSSLVADIDDALREIIDDLDSKMVGYSEGLLSARPAPGVNGRMYRATDTCQAFMDVGSRWIEPGVLLGEVKWMATPTAPSGWLECNGQGVTTSNADLRAALVAAGNPHGVDASGNPKVPDLRDYAPVGVSATHALGATFGEATHTLSAAESGVGAHGHSDNIAVGSGGAGTTGIENSSLNHGHALTIAAATVAPASHVLAYAGGVNFSDYLEGGIDTGQSIPFSTADNWHGTNGNHGHPGSVAVATSPPPHDHDTPAHTHPKTGGVLNNAGAPATAAHNNEGRRVALKAYVKA